MPKRGETAAPHPLQTLPNLVTLARIAMVPATIWLILHHRLDWAFAVFVLAGVSDAIDGWLARVLDARSALGAMLDPLADKALLVSVYVTLAVIGALPDWLAIFVVFRDVVIVGGLALLWMLGHRAEIRPLRVSKVNTFSQIALAALALFARGFEVPLEGLLTPLVWFVAATTLASLLAYLAAVPRGIR